MVHVDSFLYSDEDIDRLCDEGKMSRSYCKECGSHNTAPLSKSAVVIWRVTALFSLVCAWIVAYTFIQKFLVLH